MALWAVAGLNSARPAPCIVAVVYHGKTARSWPGGGDTLNSLHYDHHVCNDSAACELGVQSSIQSDALESDRRHVTARLHGLGVDHDVLVHRPVMSALNFRSEHLEVLRPRGAACGHNRLQQWLEACSWGSETAWGAPSRYGCVPAQQALCSPDSARRCVRPSRNAQLRGVRPVPVQSRASPCPRSNENPVRAVSG